MYIKDLKLREEPQSIYHLDIGTFTVFETFVVAELKEGLIMGFNQWRGMWELIYDHFGTSGNFGLICNRMNAFSIIPQELSLIAELFSNSPKIAIVNYTTVGRMSAQYEKRYWPFPVELFNNLSQGMDWMDDTLRPAC
jgi:hypothetical protein